MRIATPFRYLPPVTRNLLIINVAVFVLMELISAASPAEGVKLTNFFALHYILSQHFNALQLITYMFMHGGIMHLAFNMFALYMFGAVIERMMGSRKFLFYYISCGIGAALIQMGVFALIINHLADGLQGELTVAQIADMSEGAPLRASDYSIIHAAQEIFTYINVPTVGASGAIYGVLLAFGFLLPRVPLYLFFIPVPIQARWVVIGYAVLELLLGTFDHATGVAHFAHLGGMLIGLMILLAWRKRIHQNNGPWY